MGTSLRWTIADLEAFPDPLDDTRYEIIDGELYVTTQPSLEHQYASGGVQAALLEWSEATGRGRPFAAPGVIFADDDNVAPDVVWLSRERLRAARGADGKLHAAPELMVEVLSPGGRNELRDRAVKLKLYSRRGVDEYWLVDWQRRRVEVYRRAPSEPETLRLAATLTAGARLESPLLPGFGILIDRLFLPDEI
jgi:Uma2 family endonuclease